MSKKIPAKPSEVGAVKKDWGGRVPVAIVYPNSYYIGMSNLAIHTLYRSFNRDPQIVAERIFLGGKSEESGRPISDFCAATFTFSFEADYLNIPKILGGGINLRKEKRTERDPILIAGGPAVTMNPEGLSHIFDVIVAGEAEGIIDDIITVLKQSPGKAEALREMAGISYPQVPGTLDPYPTHSVIWTPDTEFGHMHLVETARGCPWGCNFCATPPVYAPYRLRSKAAILKSIEHGLPHRGHVGLIGSDVIGHPSFLEIAKELTGRDIRVSVSSMRIDRISEEVASILAKSGHKRATLGIEAGTERLRNLINKTISDTAIFSAAANLARAGITGLKLYFMIGLPDETKEDIDGIARVAGEIREIILKERKAKTLVPDISLVLTPFVPKRLTPFSDAPFAGIQYLKGRLKALRSTLGGIPNIKITGEPPRDAGMEYRLSQGGPSEICNIIGEANR